MEKNVFEYVDKDCIIIGLRQKNKKNILTAILDHLIKKNKINKNDKAKILKVLLQREQMGSTAKHNTTSFTQSTLA
jgi:mannitol/fructose-specific phosphotransferase system IIA component (Ntr-type)